MSKNATTKPDLKNEGPNSLVYEPKVLRNTTNTYDRSAVNGGTSKEPNSYEKSKEKSFEKQAQNLKENIAGPTILAKRANRGYNPKYDSKETEYVCKADAQAASYQVQVG